MSKTHYAIIPVEQVKESFHCPHCKRLLRDAVQNHEGFRLCHVCCEEIQRLPNQTCNDCGISIPPGSEVHADKAARREIAALQVYCPNQPTGCEWTGQLSSVEEHLAHCQHRGVECPNPGCSVVTTAALLQKHREECSYREVECRYCKALLPFHQLPAHYEGECQHYPQPCSQCGQPVKRRDLDEHKENNCTFEQCKGCPILVNRETTEEWIDGQSGSLHFSDPKTPFKHMQQISTRTEGLEKGQVALRAEVQNLKDNSIQIEQYVELKKEVGLAMTKVDVLMSVKEEDGVTALKTFIQEMQRTISSQNKRIEGQARDIATLKSELEERTSESFMGLAKRPSHFHSNKTSMTVGHSTYNQPTSEPSNMDGKLMQVMKSVEELQRTTSMMKVHLSELELQLQASLASTHTGSFLWRIPELARRKRDAFEGRITSIYSPPFYSGRNGYKMCIRAYLNGDGTGFNTHLSVFFVLMRGEYDPLLKWPFDCKVSLILVDQNLRQHIVQTFKPSPDSSSFQRPRSDMNVASGCPQFAKLSVLEEGNYVKNDVLFLKCIVDTSRVVHP